MRANVAPRLHLRKTGDPKALRAVMTSPFQSLLEPARAELCRRFGLRAFTLTEERAPAPGAPPRPPAVAPEGEAVILDADILLSRGELRPLVDLPTLEAVRSSARPPPKPGPVRDLLTFQFEPEPGAEPDLEALAQYVLCLLCWRPPELRVAGGGREAAFRCGALMLDLELYRRFRREQGVVDFAREARLFLPTVEVEHWKSDGGLLTVAFRSAGGAVESALGLLAAVASEPLGVDEVRLERLDKPAPAQTRLVAELMAPTAVEGTLTGAERELFVPLLRPVHFPSFAGLYRELLEDGIYVGPIRLEERREPAAPVAHGSFLFDRAFEPHRFEIAYRDELLEGAPDALAAIAGPEGFEQILLRSNRCTYHIDASDVWRWPPALVKRLLDRLVLSDRLFSPAPIAAPARVRSLRATIAGESAPVMVRTRDSAPWEPFSGMRAARGDSTVWLHAPGSLSGAHPVRLELAVDRPSWLLSPCGAQEVLVDLSDLELKVPGGVLKVDPSGIAAFERERSFYRGEAPSIFIGSETWRLEVRVAADPLRPPPPLVPIPLVQVAQEPPPGSPYAVFGSAAVSQAWVSASPEKAWFVDAESVAAPQKPAPRDASPALPLDPAPAPKNAGPQGAHSPERLLDTLEDAILGVLPPLAGVGSESAPPIPEPTAPVAEPAAPVAEPAAPVAEPAAPVAEPAAPVAEPTAPVAEPAAPVAEPAAPVAEPTAPVADRAQRVAPPAADPQPFAGASAGPVDGALVVPTSYDREPPTVVAVLGSPPPESALPSKRLVLHLEDLDAQNPTTRFLGCVALPLSESGLGLGPDGAVTWKSKSADWALGTVGERVVLRTQSKGANRLQWTGEAGSRSLRGGETARLRSGDLIEYGGRRWRVHARGEAKEVASPGPISPPEPAAPPRAGPLELALLTQDRGAAVHAVAIPGGKLGLAIGPDGSVLWQTRDPGVFRIWVGVDGRLILLRPPVAPAVKLVRGRRWLEVPAKKPVVLLDGDELDTGGARVRLRVVGVAGEVRPPWTEEPLADFDEVTPVDPPCFPRRMTPTVPGEADRSGADREGSTAGEPAGAATLAHVAAVSLPDATALATPAETPAVAIPWPDQGEEKTKA
jgi:hypothetical protein